MIHTGVPCLECHREIVRDRYRGAQDRLMFCGNSCRGTWCNRGRSRSHLGPVSSQVIALVFDAREVTPALVAVTLAIPRKRAKATLLRMWNARRLVRVGRGVYSLPAVIQ